jgi:peptide/nickel transport system permease protein
MVAPLITINKNAAKEKQRRARVGLSNTGMKPAENESGQSARRCTAKPGKTQMTHRYQNDELQLVERGAEIKPMARIWKNPLTCVGILLLFSFVLLASSAQVLAPSNPASIDLLHRLSSPAHGHLFGTDELGRDVLSRVIFGARLSLLVAGSVVACSLTLGIVLGGIAGYYGGAIDTVINTFAMNAFMAMPGILLAIAFVAFLGPGVFNLILALSIGGWVGYARLVRAQVLAVKEREFVESARALGASDLRIFVRHILPNILQPLIVQSAIGMAGAVLAEATLSFLGLGVPPPTASWGSMLDEARSHLFDAPHLVLFPALAVMLCVLCFNFLGDALRDYLDPRTRLSLGL